jgi:hypothetical protein
MSLAVSRRLHVDNASLTELHITGDAVHLVRFNDTGHLTALREHLATPGS